MSLIEKDHVPIEKRFLTFCILVFRTPSGYRPLDLTSVDNYCHANGYCSDRSVLYFCALRAAVGITVVCILQRPKSLVPRSAVLHLTSFHPRQFHCREGRMPCLDGVGSGDWSRILLPQGKFRAITSATAFAKEALSGSGRPRWVNHWVPKIFLFSESG